MRYKQLVNSEHDVRRHVGALTLSQKDARICKKWGKIFQCKSSTKQQY